MQEEEHNPDANRWVGILVSHLRSSLKSNYKNENCKKKHHPGFSRMPWLCQVSSASAFIYTCPTGTFISGVSPFCNASTPREWPNCNMAISGNPRLNNSLSGHDQWSLTTTDAILYCLEGKGQQCQHGRDQPQRLFWENVLATKSCLDKGVREQFFGVKIEQVHWIEWWTF